MRFSGAPTSSMSTVQIALPDWDANEISRKLEENTRYLAEWTDLLDKNGFLLFSLCLSANVFWLERMKREEVQPSDMHRHVALVSYCLLEFRH
jgi:hypothetical protein